MERNSTAIDILRTLLTRFHQHTSSAGETAADIVLEVIGQGKGWSGQPTREQVRAATTLLVFALGQSGNPQEQALAVRMLGELHPPRGAVAPLLVALHDEESGVRANAAEALGHLRSRSAVPHLVLLLTGRESAQRLDAARKVDRQDFLTFTMNSPSAVQRENRVRLAAVEALGRIGDRRAVAPLLQLLSQKKPPQVVEATTIRVAGHDPLAWLDEMELEPQEDRELREAIIEALAVLRDERAVEALCVILREEPMTLGKYAARALQQIRDRRATGPLIAAFASQGSELHQANIQALCAFGGEDLIELLIVALSSGSKHMREGAAQVLGELRATQALEPLIGALLQEEDTWVRSRIVEALGEIGDQQAAEPLFAFFRHDAEEHVRSAAVLALAKLRDERAFEPLVKALTREEPPIFKRLVFGGPLSHGAAVRGLADLGDQRAVEPLLAALEREAGYTQTLVVDALAALGDGRSVEPLLRILTREPLQSQDDMLLRHTIDALAKLGDRRAVNPLIVCFEQEAARLTTSGNFFAFNAEHAAQALGEMGDQRAIEPLASYLKDHARIRWDIASAVIDALGKLGNPATIPVLNLALRYEGERILELAPAARSRYRIYEVSQKAHAAITSISERNR